MTDYTKLIDAETWAFIRETESWFPPESLSESIEQVRARYDQMCAVFLKSYPSGVAAEDFAMGGIPVRKYQTAVSSDLPLVLYMHGGGYVVGGLNSHDDVCAEICSKTSFDVLAIDYRLAPEYLHPASYNDCQTVFDWVQEKTPRPIILVGDSAGGGLAAAIAHKSRGHRNLLGQVLIYPGLGAGRNTGSAVTHANAPLLTTKESIEYGRIRSNGTPPIGDPTFAPLHDTDFAGLPATVVITAECDPLASNGPEYCAALIAAGGQAICVEEKGLVHGYLRARHSVARARVSFARINRAIEILGQGQGVTRAALVL